MQAVGFASRCSCNTLHAYLSHSSLGDTLVTRAAATPGPTPLDRILQKAKVKHKLALPGVTQPEQTQQGAKPQRPPGKTSKPSAASQSKQQSNIQPQDDESLLRGITERERDSVFESIQLAVDDDGLDGLWDGDDDRSSSGIPAKRRSAPASARDDRSSAPMRGFGDAVAQPVASSSGFKGFGTPLASRPSSKPPAATGTTAARAAPALPVSPNASPRRHGASSQEPAASTSSVAGQPQQQQQQQQRQDHASGRMLRVALYNAEEARTRALLQELGLGGRVDVVTDLRAADAILAAKLTRAGKHVNLIQAERTAANAGIPFVVVGRNMTANNLRTALEPLLADPGSPEAEAAAAKASAARQRAPTAAELQAHRIDVIHGFGQMLRNGGMPPSS